MMDSTERLRTFDRGDTVRFDGAREWRQPFTVTVEYHSGTYRIEDKFGQPVVSADPSRLTPA